MRYLFSCLLASGLSVLAAPAIGADEPPAYGLPFVSPLSFGAPLGDKKLDVQRGGADLFLNKQNLKATMSDTAAHHLTTGSNSIGGGSFANSSGLPMVIQNSGNNVIIQNSTILNLNLQ